MLGDQIRLVRGFVSSDVCRRVIEFVSRYAPSHPVRLNCPVHQTPNVMQQFDLNPKTLQPVLLEVFEPMKKKWEELTGRQTSWDDPLIHPQVIHYPVGGGFFGRHSHPLEPQRFGMVLNLTDGLGTMFHLEEGDYQIHARAGDLTMFRYDIPHSVPPVEPEEPLGFYRTTGRWVALLPFFE